MDRLAAMETFTRVVEAGSFSLAAERLGVAKSAVSRRVAELEAHLGVQLFRRTTRRLNLTDTGQSFYERCVQILADVAEAELAVSREHGMLRGRLRVAAPLTFGLMHLAPALVAFNAHHPEVTFELDFNDRQIDLLQEGVDVAIRIARLADSSLIARRLATITHGVWASPGYLATHGVPRTPQDLVGHRCLVYTNTPEPRVWPYTGPDGVEGSVRVDPAMQANNGEFLRQAAEADQGIVLQPTFISYESVAGGRLVPVLASYRWRTLYAYAVYPHTRHPSQRVRAFVDFLVERYAGVPYWEQAASGEGAW